MDTSRTVLALSDKIMSIAKRVGSHLPRRLLLLVINLFRLLSAIGRLGFANAGFGVHFRIK